MVLASGLAFGSVVVGAQSGVDQRIAAVDETPQARAVGGGIELAAPADAPCRFTIYSITGQIIKSVEVSGTTVVEMQRGCYIIKCSSWLKKVVVR